MPKAFNFCEFYPPPWDEQTRLLESASTPPGKRIIGKNMFINEIWVRVVNNNKWFEAFFRNDSNLN